MRELLIVGIDPGTTAGYAALDLQGNVLKTRSSKQLELNSLIEEIVQLGSILAIGTDKKKCPMFVQKAAAKTGARIIAPKDDLGFEEKRSLLQNFDVRNDHERDALAAARYAYKELEPLLRRISKSLEGEGKQALLREVTENVVLTGVNIKEVVREIDEKAARESEKNRIQETQITVEAKPNNSSETMQLLLLKSIEKENDILREYNRRLVDNVRQANNEIRKLASRREKMKPSQARLDERESHRAELARKLQKIITEKDLQIGKLAQEQNSLNAILASRSNGWIVVKKLRTLGFEELEQKKDLLQISENDAVLVENAESFSEKALRFLQQKNVMVLTRKKVNDAAARVIRDAGLTMRFIDGISLLESEHFASMSKQKLNELRQINAATNALGIIEGYKEERRMELM